MPRLIPHFGRAGHIFSIQALFSGPLYRLNPSHISTMGSVVTVCAGVASNCACAGAGMT